jgi:hypothetical protein
MAASSLAFRYQVGPSHPKATRVLHTQEVLKNINLVFDTHTYRAVGSQRPRCYRSAPSDRTLSVNIFDTCSKLQG